MPDVVIDPEFAALCPPLRDDEHQGLEDSLLADGCRDALLVWAEGNVLLDGHHRHAICQRHGIPYRTEAVSLADREAAAVWVLRHQAARRNLTDDQRAMMAEELRRRLSAIAMSEQRRQAAISRWADDDDACGLHASCNPHGNDNERQPVNSRTEAADAMGVSERKVKQSKVVLDADPELAEKVKAGDVTLAQAVREVRRAEQRAALESIEALEVKAAAGAMGENERAPRRRGPGTMPYLDPSPVSRPRRKPPRG